MADIAPRDANWRPIIQAASNANNRATVDLWADPTTHRLLVDAGSITLTPSGTQDVNITKVSGSAFALGQQLAAASLPIVLTASQLATLTPPTNTGYALDAS